MIPHAGGPTLPEPPAGDAVTTAAVVAMNRADTPVAALRAAAASYKADSVTLRSLGHSEWSFFYDTVSRELTKLADQAGAS